MYIYILSPHLCLLNSSSTVLGFSAFESSDTLIMKLIETLDQTSNIFLLEQYKTRNINPN